MGQFKIVFKRVFSKKYIFNISNFENTFLTNSINANCANINLPLPKKIFCFWTGNNEMSPHREIAYNILVKNAGVEVVLITPKNLNEYLLPGHPLHPGFDYLSLVHKADYLRCYFMHHYGGGYSDIKGTRKTWDKLFDVLANNDDKWVVGYREIGEKGVAPVAGLLGDAIRTNWHLLIGNCSYIFKPLTPFTYEWYAELHKRLDGYHDILKHNPGNIMGDNPGYPIPWTGILGDIFHPLCLKYFPRLIYTNRIKPILKDFR